MELAQDIRLSAKEWNAFCSGYSPFRFDAVVDRIDLSFPDWFMPNARGAVVPSAQVLKPISGRRVRPAYWHEIAPGIFRADRGQLGLTAHRFDTLWALIAWARTPNTLAFHCGSTPVIFRNYREAMWLCRYCGTRTPYPAAMPKLFMATAGSQSFQASLIRRSSLSLLPIGAHLKLPTVHIGSGRTGFTGEVPHWLRERRRTRPFHHAACAPNGSLRHHPLCEPAIGGSSD